MSFALYTNARLVLRLSLLVWGVVSYITDGERIDAILSGTQYEIHVMLAVTWIIMMARLIMRFFPIDTESMGARREYRKYHKPRPLSEERLKAAVRKANGQALRSLAAWLALNGVIYALYFTRRISIGIVFLVSLFYGVSDIICIKFFCPFQRWLMKNRCCTTCRIYNWDFMMMNTPTILIPNLFYLPLWVGSAILTFRWEWRWRKYPERFLEEGNESLMCRNCQHPGTCQSCVRKKAK